jgi:hypothetical protein
MATHEEVQQQISIELDRMYDQEMKSRKWKIQNNL